MQLLSFINKKIITVVALLFAGLTVMAQTTPAAEKTVTSDNNQLAILLVIMTVVLAFVIWGLGQVLVAMSKQVMEKNKRSKVTTAAVIITGLLLASQTASAQTAADAVKVLPNYGGLSSTTFYMFVTVIAVEVVAILFLAFSIRRVYAELLPPKPATAVAHSPIKEWWARMDKKLFTRAVSVEKEADILLDHDYDGIQELDNALPPWWKYGFYITIVVAFIYIFNFHVFGSGKNPTEEYVAEMEKAKIEIAAFEAQNKDRIDEANVPMAGAEGLQFAKGVFKEKCVACHGEFAEGKMGLGPNLTDDYWIHKGSLNDIYSSIKNGYPDKGMASWIAFYNPKEVSYLASYIKTLHGSNPPNPKAPQGDLYSETGTAAAGDSAKAVKPADSTVVIKTAAAVVKDTVKTKAAPVKK